LINDGRAALPLWRLLAGIAVFVGFIVDLSFLVPVYLRNYELQRDLKAELRRPGAAGLPDSYWRTEFVELANARHLPVIPKDISVAHSKGATTVGASYKVMVDLGLYQVDLHFHPVASSE
jgi:hypothetical protein